MSAAHPGWQSIRLPFIPQDLGDARPDGLMQGGARLCLPERPRLPLPSSWEHCGLLGMGSSWVTALSVLESHIWMCCLCQTSPLSLRGQDSCGGYAELCVHMVYVCECACMSLCVCMHVVCVNVGRHVCTCKCVWCLHVSVCTCACVWVHACECASMCEYTHMCTCVYVCMVYMHMSFSVHFPRKSEVPALIPLLPGPATGSWSAEGIFSGLLSP